MTDQADDPAVAFAMYASTAATVAVAACEPPGIFKMIISTASSRALASPETLRERSAIDRTRRVTDRHGPCVHSLF